MSFATSSHRLRAAWACDCCRQAKAKCSQGLPCQRCARLNASCHYSERRSACRRAKKKSSHGIHESVNAGGHSNNKRADRSKKAELKNTSPTPLGATTPPRDHSSHSKPICTSARQTLPADDYSLYHPAMDGLGIVDVTGTEEDLARPDASQSSPTLDTNSGYVPASIMPSVMLPNLRLEDLSFHPTFSLSPMSSLPGTQSQCIMMPDPFVSNCASTYKTSYDYQLYDPMMSGWGIPNVLETSLSEGPMLDVNSSRGRATAAGTSQEIQKLHSACDKCHLAKEKCSKECDSVQKPRKTGTVFLCLFEQCDRTSADVGFPSRWNCYDHMRRVHDYATPYDDYKLQARAVPQL